jgi:hypothetical protein
VVAFTNTLMYTLRGGLPRRAEAVPTFEETGPVAVRVLALRVTMIRSARVEAAKGSTA